MKVKSILLTGAVACALTLGVKAEQPAAAAGDECVRYEASWESIDKRPVPQWYRDAKFGIIVHWGPYSIPAYAQTTNRWVWRCYAEQYQCHLRWKNERTYQHEKFHDAPYADFAAQFKAENYDPAEWADLFKRAGAKYAVLTSKHFDGFALWPSPLSPYYNAGAMGPKRDLCGDFITAMRGAGLKCGFYYSLREEANPLFRKALKEHTLPEWSRTVCQPQMKDLVERYKIDILCPDGEHDILNGDDSALGVTEFLKWLFNESSMRDTIAVSDRWGKDCWGRHGGYWTTEYGKLNMSTSAIRDGMPQAHPWEDWRGIGWSFGWNKFEHAWNYMSEAECIEALVWCVSGGGNLMLDVGPTADGRIPVIMQDRLLAMGRWLDVNGEAIYGSRIWWTKDYESAKANRLYFTRKGETVYAITFRWPDAARPITMHDVGKVKNVTLVGVPDAKVDWREEGGTLTFSAPPLAPDRLPCQHAWTFKVER